MRTRSEALWDALRYGALLRAAGRSALAGRIYSSIVARVEYARDIERRTVAERRIAQWMGFSRRAAREVYRQALRSEAQEEADSISLMRVARFPSERIELSGHERHSGRPRIYAAVHLGSPVLAYLRLCLTEEPGLPVIARELDEANPMPASKQAYGRRKVAWVEATAGVRFLGTDALAVLRARERLVGGGAVYAAVDVPGDVVARQATLSLCGERLSFASGIFDLAVMTGADVQLVAARNQDGKILVSCRPPVAAASGAALAAKVAGEMENLVRELPGEWWLWPFLVPVRAS